MYPKYSEYQKKTANFGVKTNVKTSIGETFRTSLASTIPITDDILKVSSKINYLKAWVRGPVAMMPFPSNLETVV